jgi:glycosyltransferase involved in cell wall biosynthesis
MKVALVHDWLIHMRGGEKVLEALAEIFPGAKIYTLFCDRKRLSPVLQQMTIKTSFLQYWPGIRHCYRWLLPILPLAIRSLRIEEADLVISSSHCVAKGISIPPQAYHLCYCHTPMRYLWGFEEEYFGKFPFWVRPVLRTILSRLRQWDIESNVHVHQFISNSENVRRRIQQFYERDAHVIHPPWDARYYEPVNSKGDYYLAVSHFVPYKRVDLVIEAFNELDRQLLIVGTGPLEKTYRRLRRNEQISFLGPLSEISLRRLYSGARALIFPTEEDFGIVPLEAQACGTPVIAYGKGGALESVRTGIFFEEQTPEAIRKAVREFEKLSFDRELTAKSVADFEKTQFQEKMRAFMEQVLSQNPAYAAR